MSLPVTSGWVQGAYLLLLVASNGSKSYVPLTIRDDSSHADLAIQLPTTTWQAYNRWGGYSLYVGPHGHSDRSYVVSFDRPYLQTHGAPEFMDRARPFLRRPEQNFESSKTKVGVIRKEMKTSYLGKMDSSRW